MEFSVSFVVVLGAMGAMPPQMVGRVLLGATIDEGDSAILTWETSCVAVVVTCFVPLAFTLPDSLGLNRIGSTEGSMAMLPVVGD